MHEKNNFFFESICCFFLLVLLAGIEGEKNVKYKCHA